MAHVVFMRAVNVGGHQTFRPAVLARDLAPLGVKSLGAAGTFVVRGRVTPAALRAAILAKLPFEPAMTICPGRELLALRDARPFAKLRDADGARPHVSVLERGPAKSPKLPLLRPDGASWQVRLLALSGRFALSVRRPGSGTMVYPNEVVESAFGVPATTRNWDTVLSICEALES